VTESARWHKSRQAEKKGAHGREYGGGDQYVKKKPGEESKIKELSLGKENV